MVTPVVVPGGGSGPAADVAYVHEQSTPATVWTVTHSLGWDPAGVLVVRADGTEVVTIPQYLTPGESLRVDHDVATAGRLYLS